MRVIQPQAQEYTVVLSQMEMDIIVHALAHRSEAEYVADMPHYKRDLQGINGASGKLYEQFIQYVSLETTKSSRLSQFK